MPSELGGYERPEDRPKSIEQQIEEGKEARAQWRREHWDEYDAAMREDWKKEQEQVRAEATSAPEMEPERVQAWRDWLPAWKKGRPTSAAVFDAGGERGRIDSGGRLENGEVDERAVSAKRWMEEGGWSPSFTQVDKHVEVKVVVDMIEGRLPKHVTLVTNNELCPENPKRPDVPTCEGFIRDTLHPGMTLRVYDPKRPWYFEGEA